MDENEVIPFGSERSRELLRLRQQSGVPQTPVAQPIQTEPRDQELIPFGTTQSRQMLGSRAAPPRDYSWSEVPGAALQNLPRSAGQFYGGVAEAVLNPIDTAVGTAQLAGGAVLSALPEGAQNWLMSVANNPERVQESIDIARAAGGFLADRYGTAAGFRRALAEDPVGVAADFSTLLGGGAAAAARVAPRASQGLQLASDFTNPFMPLPALAETRVPGTGRTVGQNIGLLGEVVRGGAGEATARNIITQALGEQNIPTIAQLSDPRFRDMSAAEAVLASGINRPQFQALARDVAAPDPSNVFFQREQARPAQRVQALEAVTPDIQAAREARSAAADPLYAAARDPNAMVDTSPIIASINETIARNPGNTQLRASLNEVKRGLRQSQTAEQLASVNDNIRRLLDSRDNRLIQSNLINVREQINNLLPGMAEARQTFAQMSEPVNQAQILGAMRQRLEGPMDQERPGQFMRVLGEGEEALIRTSTGAPRFQQGDLMRILTEEQGGVVTDIAEQLRRERAMDVQARRGAQGLQQIVEANRPLGFRAPNVLNREIMIFNRTLNVLEGRISDSTRNALERAMFSGADLNRFLNSVPDNERGIISRALGQAASQATDIGNLRNVGVLQQVIEGAEEEPFRAELRGMAR